MHSKRFVAKHGANRKGLGVTALAFVFAAVFLFPIFIAVINSLKDKGEILRSALALPARLNLENYELVLTKSGFLKAFFGSCFVTGGGIVLNLTVSSMAGYALARWKSRWSAFLTVFLLSSMFVPFHTIMITLLKTAKALGLTGKLWGLILIYCGLQCPIPIFLVKGFVSTVPHEMEEAARIDGCGTARMFRSIVLPLLRPILATVAVLNTLWIWNDFLLPYLILGKPSTIPLSQMYFYGQYNQQWHLIMAGFVISTIPVVVFFLVMQKYIVQGISSGAVKG